MTDEEHDEMVLAKLRKEVEIAEEKSRNSKRYDDEFWRFFCSMASILKVR